MIPAARERILAALADDDLVLDVGGWAKPFARADWVLDLAPYETRGLYGYDEGARAAERFTAETWVQADICAREPWPFDDGQFAFAICSHTLEDVRDPIWVCSELQRVARAGYVEVPSRLEEQTYGVQGPWVGWGHHHWLIERTPDGKGFEFVFKHHVLHGRESDHFPSGFTETLTPQQRVVSLFWEGTLPAHERVITDAAELDAYLAGFVAEHGPPRRRRRLLRRR